jgi:hypothetical protein
MYQVRLNASPEDFLDWDAPLSGQSEAVQDAYRRASSSDILSGGTEDWSDNPFFPPELDMSLFDNSVGMQAYNTLAQKRLDVIRNMPGERLQNIADNLDVNPHAAASDALREAGIPGLRYLDGDSRTNPQRLFVDGEEITDPIDSAAASMMRIWNGRQSRIAMEMRNASDHGLTAAQRDEVLRRLPNFEGADIQWRREGTSNYVVWDDSIIEILKRYGLIPPVAAGSAMLMNGSEAEASQ